MEAGHVVTPDQEQPGCEYVARWYLLFERRRRAYVSGDNCAMRGDLSFQEFFNHGGDECEGLRVGMCGGYFAYAFAMYAR